MKTEKKPYLFPARSKMKIMYHLFSTTDDNLVHKDPVVQERAISAVPPFVNEYFSGNKGALDGLLNHYTSQLNASELHLRGFALALGSLPANILNGRLHLLLPILMERTKISKNTETWAEGRRDVIKAIINIIKTVGVSSDGQQGNHFCFSLLKLEKKFLCLE